MYPSFSYVETFPFSLVGFPRIAATAFGSLPLKSFIEAVFFTSTVGESIIAEDCAGFVTSVLEEASVLDSVNELELVSVLVSVSAELPQAVIKVLLTITAAIMLKIFLFINYLQIITIIINPSSVKL